MSSSTSTMHNNVNKPQKPLINLIRGWPAPSLLPASQIQTAMATVLSNPTLSEPSLEYGPDGGYEPLREELATYLSKFFHSTTTSTSTTRDPSRICITGGASQSIANIMQSFTDPGYTQAVWLVAPVYHLVCPIFKDGGFAGRLRAVPEDEGGVDLEWLERGLKEHEGKGAKDPVYKDPSPHRKIYKHVLYCVPTSSNPSSQTMSLHHRRALVELARKYDVLVIADDIYDFLQWPFPPSSPTIPDRLPISSNPPPRLVDIDLSLPPHPSDPRHFGHAISNGSFSKISGPGVRTGWVEARPRFAYGLAQTGASKSGGAPSQLCASVLSEMMRSGSLDEHLHTVVRPGLAKRHARILDAARRYLEGGDLAEVVINNHEAGSFGGYFIWLKLAEGFDAEKVAAKAMADENLVVAAGTMFSVPGDDKSVDLSRNIRLCFSWEDEDRIEEGVERLGRVLRTWQETAAEKEGDAGNGVVVAADEFK